MALSVKPGAAVPELDRDGSQLPSGSPARRGAGRVCLYDMGLTVESE